MNDFDEWRKTRLEAKLWWCEDEICNCYQPQIDRIRPNLKAGYPWIIREPIWRGEFHSEPDSNEFEEQRRELIGAGDRFGIALDDNLYGIKEEYKV